MSIVIGILIGLAAGGAAALILVRLFAGSGIAGIRRTRQLLIEEARREADALRREAQLEAKEEVVRIRAELEQGLQERRAEAVQAQERVRAKEGEIERQLTELERREQGIVDRETHAK